MTKVGELRARLCDPDADSLMMHEACLDANAVIETLASENERLREALVKCSNQFGLYVTLHMKKQPPDMDKAATNQEFVEMIDAALSNPIEGKTE